MLLGLPLAQDTDQVFKNLLIHKLAFAGFFI